MNNKGIATLLAGMAMMNEMAGNSPNFLPNLNPQKRTHEYRDNVKTQIKGLSAEEMGTSHKHKTRAERKRSKK